MSTFNLPDLGEGLPDAEIHEWHVKVGDTVAVDQPLVSMETAKAVVDVPSPQAGVIKKLHGQPGDIIDTGKPLVEFASDAPNADAGTVVGSIESSGKVETENFIVGAAKHNKSSTVKATPAVRALARKHQIDLQTISGSGENGIITKADVEAAIATTASHQAGDGEPLRGARRAMALTMSQSHKEVVPVTIFDDADIDAWSADEDITVRLIQAMVAACQAEPNLNATFDGKQLARHPQSDVNLGIAMDTGEDLFVPVIKAADKLDAKALRETINRFKDGVRSRDIPQQDLHGASITLSNFGNFAGRYASPIIVPPTVAILAVGKLRETVVAVDGQPAVHKVLPLSLSFDHRAITGGEATRFLGTVIAVLEKAH